MPHNTLLNNVCLTSQVLCFVFCVCVCHLCQREKMHLLCMAYPSQFNEMISDREPKLHETEVPAAWQVAHLRAKYPETTSHGRHK